MDQRGYRRQPQASVSTLIRTGGLDALRCAVGLASSAAPHSLSSGSGPLTLAPAELELDACKRSAPDATYILYSNTALLSQLAAKNFTRVAKGVRQGTCTKHVPVCVSFTCTDSDSTKSPVSSMDPDPI